MLAHRILHSLVSSGHEHEGEVPTDIELGRLVATLAKNVKGTISKSDVICDPAAGSGNLISSSIDIMGLMPNQIIANDINPKLYSYQQDKIVRLYDNEVPNYIILDQDMDDNYKLEVIEKCDESGQPHSMVESEIFSKFAIGTIGYSAQETIRNFLYQYTSYNESISIQCIPVYSLDVNRRITIKDKKSGINGDYIINSITMPLSPNNVMSITASRALDRI